MRTQDLLLVFAVFILILLCNDVYIIAINIMNGASVEEHTTMFARNANIEQIVQLLIERPIRSGEAHTLDKDLLSVHSAATINMFIIAEEEKDTEVSTVLHDYIVHKKVIQDPNIDANTLSDVLKVLIIDSLIQKYNVNLNKIEYSKDGIPLKDKLDSFYNYLRDSKNIDFHQSEHKVYVHTINDANQIILNSKIVIPFTIAITLYQISHLAVLLCNCFEMNMNKMVSYNQIILECVMDENGKLLVSNDRLFDKDRTIHHYLMLVSCLATPNGRRSASISSKLFKAQQNANIQDLLRQDIYGNTPLHYAVHGYAFIVVKRSKIVNASFDMGVLSRFLSNGTDWSQLSWKWKPIQSLIQSFVLTPKWKMKSTKLKDIESMDKNIFMNNIKLLLRSYCSAEIQQLIGVKNYNNRTVADVLRQIFDANNIRNDPLMEYLLNPIARFNPMVTASIKPVLSNEDLPQRPLVVTEREVISNITTEYKFCSNHDCEQKQFPLEYNGAICKLCTEQKIWFCSKLCLAHHLKAVHKKFKTNAS